MRGLAREGFKERVRTKARMHEEERNVDWFGLGA